MSDAIENRLRLAVLELEPPSRETEERALRAALAELPGLRSRGGSISRKGFEALRRALRLPRRRKLVLLAAAALPAAVVAVVAWSLLSSGSSSPTVAGGAGGSSDRFPSESFTDWVSYGDQVSVFSVVSEEEIRPSPEDLERDLEQGIGYLGRVVTLRIERTIWRREGAPSVEGSIRVLTWGWSLDENGERRPGAPWGEPRLEVGKRYLAPLVQAPGDGSLDWMPLSGGATLPLEGDLITTAGIKGLSIIATAMNGQSVDALAALLAHSRPDPIAAKYFHLDPDARWQAVLRERGETE